MGRQRVLHYDLKNVLHKRKKKKTDTLDFTKIKNICPVKDTIKRMKIKSQYGINLQITYPTKDLYPGYIKKLLKLNGKKIIQFGNKQTKKDLNRYFKG